MGRLGNGLRRLAARFHRDRLDDELRLEMDAHIEWRRQQLVDEGTDSREAAWQARRMFGNVTALREEARDMWSFRWIDSLVQDARFGGRLLLRAPLFTAAAVLSLGIGIGSAVAVFTVADAVLFRPLAVRAPVELRAFEGTLTAGAVSKTLAGVQADGLERIQRGADFADFVGFRTTDDVVVQAAGVAPRPVRVEFVSGNYFDVLGAAISPGRAISAADATQAATPIVISDALWRSSFNTGGSIVGRSIALNGHPAVVIGIVRDFRGLLADRPADVFAPLSSTAAIDPTASNFVIRLVGRLKPGVSVGVAEQKLLPLYVGPSPTPFKAEQFRIALSDASRGTSDARGALERPIWLGLGLVAVLLIVACTNTGGLLLSRFATRRGEFGVRIAIGASRSRLARQLAVEALLLAALAALAGLLVGSSAGPLLIRAIAAAGSQAVFDLRFDSRLVMFTAAVSFASAIGAAAAMLFRLWRSETTALLSGETRTIATGARHMTHVLIAAQVACSLLLVVGAVSMGRTLLNLHRIALGFEHARTFVVTINATGLIEPALVSAYHARLNQRIAAAPGVDNATMAQVPPLTDAATTGTVDVAGFTPSDDSDRVSRMFFIGPDYFETLGMPLIAGRPITEEDATSRARVAVVNDRFASFFFGSPANAVGRLVNRDTRIVGVVADARYNAPRDEVPRAMFVPYGPVRRAQMSHIVRASGDPAAAIGAVRKAVAEHDPRLRPRITTAEELLGAALGRERFFATIATTLSTLALLLACMGLYAAVAYAVAQRRGELAVRLALGASASDIMALVLKDPLQTTLAGLAAGLPAAYIVMRWTASLLYGVSPFDPLTVIACAGALLCIGVLAAVWPARQAARIDPVTALKS